MTDLRVTLVCDADRWSPARYLPSRPPQGLLVDVEATRPRRDRGALGLQGARRSADRPPPQLHLAVDLTGRQHADPGHTERHRGRRAAPIATVDHRAFMGPASWSWLTPKALSHIPPQHRPLGESPLHPQRRRTLLAVRLVRDERQ